MGGNGLGLEDTRLSEDLESPLVVLMYVCTNDRMFWNENGTNDVREDVCVL